MSKFHFYRRMGVVHISPEAERAFKYLAERHGNIFSLGADVSCLRSVLDEPAPKISMEALAGVSICVDLARLAIAAIPAEDAEMLEFKKFIFEDVDPLTADAALLPLLARASIMSDEFRLRVRKGRKK